MGDGTTPDREPVGPSGKAPAPALADPDARARDGASEPLDRFRAICLALGTGSRWWSDSAWLRFAAQAAAMRPADPGETARAIAATADQLCQQAHWYETLASPLNQVIAATLVQMGDSAAAFTAEVVAARKLFHAAGFHLEGRHLVTAILALRVLSGGRSATTRVVERMHELYVRMKAHHWWLTGGEEVPLCALLTAHPGTAEEIAAAIDVTYHHLHGQGFASGKHLLTAANLLALAVGPAPVAAERFLALGKIIHQRSLPFWSEEYEGVALLSLLDHDPELVLTRLEEVTEALEELLPLQFTEVDFNVAVDLVYLDLVRFDAQLRRLGQPEEVERMDAQVRLQRAASLILVRVPPIPAIEGGATRWNSGP